MENVSDRIKGCVFGQAIGDALGLGAEFMTKEEVNRYYPQGLVSYSQILQDAHRSRWIAGSWTDDTDMMICVANARRDNHFDLNEIALNFKDWFNGDPLGIGQHTFNVLCFRDYLDNPIKAAEIVWKMYGCKSAANGGVMRTSILGTSPLVDEKEVADVCRLTHHDSRCVGSCVVVTKIIQRLIFDNVEISYNEIVNIAKNYDERMLEYIELAKNDDPSVLSLDDVTMGYTLKTLAVALWALWHCGDFKSGLLSVVNLGGDADTNAAVACALLGAKYGFSMIPHDYIDGLQNKPILEKICDTAISEVYAIYSSK